jgi:hypothetical protein
MIRKPKSNTCIAAIKNRYGKITVAADRRASSGFDHSMPCINPKVMKRDGLILAATGDSALCELVVEHISIPKMWDLEPNKYMFHVFRPHLYKALIKHDYANEQKQVKLPHEVDVEVLVACQGSLFSVFIAPYSNSDPNGHISICQQPIPYATGCGGIWALSSLITSTRLGETSTRKKLELALQIAAEHSPGCGDGYDQVTED